MKNTSPVHRLSPPYTALYTHIKAILLTSYHQPWALQIGLPPAGGGPHATRQIPGPLLPVVLILLVTLFGVRSVKGLLRWWGIPFLIVGLAGIGLAVSALPG